MAGFTGKLIKFTFGAPKLFGVTGYLPAVYTRRTAESDAWTLHRALSLGSSNSLDSKSESDSNTDCEMATAYPHEDAEKLALDKSEETYKEWGKYWQTVKTDQSASILDVIQGSNIDWGTGAGKTAEEKSAAGDVTAADKPAEPPAKESKERRWFFAMRHGERVDLTYGQWVPFCFDENGTYVRKDLNMPLTLTERAGGKEAYDKDTPLTRVGRLQARLVGEGLRLAGIKLTHVYASCALRCIETAHHMLEGLEADPSIKIRVEPGLFEYKLWHLARGMAPFMTLEELAKGGLRVDMDYKPYVEIDLVSPETLEEFYKRGEIAMHSAAKDTEAEGGNVMFVGHAATLDHMVVALTRLREDSQEYPPYQISKHLLRIPYCALGAMRDKPWQVLSPPCPPSINSSSGRFDWKILLDL